MKGGIDKTHILLRRPDSGRIAVRKSDISVVQRSPWGCLVRLASNGMTVEVEQTLEELVALVPALRLHANDTVIDPAYIISVSETADGLHCVVAGGIALKQTGADLDQYFAAMRQLKDID